MDKDGGETVDEVKLCAAPAATVWWQPFLSGTVRQHPSVHVGSHCGKLGQWARSISNSAGLGPV
jgi:hypothetical protein